MKKENVITLIRIIFRQAYGSITNSRQSYASIFFEQLDKYLLK
ncbi:hypothetical protein BC059799_5215 [Bacillus cereus NVH0597-99]|nr:hypothetical protein BC059799_5215 [Bacillus cereus NVH0597-99]